MGMAGYIPFLKKFVDQLEIPRILEIGPEHGVMTLPLLFDLAKKKERFAYVMVDVKLSERLGIILSNLDFASDQNVTLLIDNSLSFLENNREMQFDLVMVDGDHNYHTVSNELRLIKDLLAPHALVIVDDYHGRWSERDGWYSERESHSDERTQGIATKPIETEKHGVKPAVDEFLESVEGWKAITPIKGEPVLLVREEMLRTADGMMGSHVESQQPVGFAPDAKLFG